jgi:hypothetical protein
VSLIVEGQIFVFGANRAGRHGKGAAKHALDHYGAIYGQGEGRQGNSYGIPTKDEHIKTLPLVEIKRHVETFLAYAGAKMGERFLVTAIGTGLAGYRHAQIAPMFRTAPRNCILPFEWHDIVSE